ncbi:hypothetical protein AKJ09_00627 [Labilithrix luteola]|uniref:Uncharacterized protein n=1 Tax=Labilithrix luteola TaxID=1391654 RepID=A0A0K1PK97_9BACT|nr:hypothetical protein AKJ09_00627 [Labilithrix luteola]
MTWISGPSWRSPPSCRCSDVVADEDGVSGDDLAARSPCLSR